MVRYMCHQSIRTYYGVHREYLNIIRTLLSLHFLLLCCYNLPANVDTLIKSQFERSEIVICKPSV